MNENIFKKYDTRQRNESFKKILIQERGRKCECCHNEKWMGKPINLELHHKDGDRTNCVKENLQLLCPNCHSYTDSYCSKIQSRKEISDEELIIALSKSKTIRQALLSVGLSDAGANYDRARQLANSNNIIFTNLNQKKENYCIDCGRPICLDSIRCAKCNYKYHQNFLISRETLKKKIRENSFVAIGKEYGVSDTAVKKWCIKYHLPSKKKDIKQFSKEEWEQI